MPFVATPENVGRVASFIRSFPLSASWQLTDEEVMQYVLSPNVVFIEIDQCLIMLDDIKLGLSAHTGFLFWDRKVSGNEKMLREAYTNIAKMFDLQRIQCNVPLPNRIMYRMCEKVGFTNEGRLRNAFVIQREGERELTDILIYGVLRSELG